MRINEGKRQLMAIIAAAVLGLAMVTPATAASGGVTVSGVVSPSLTLELGTTDVFFGPVRPDGVDTVFVDVVAAPQGACYVANAKVDYLVQSNVPWQGYINGETQPGHTAGTDVSDLRWKEEIPPPGLLTYNHCVSNSLTNPVATAPSWSNWVSGGPQSGPIKTHEFALRVEWTDAPGTIDIKVTYKVEQM